MNIKITIISIGISTIEWLGVVTMIFGIGITGLALNRKNVLVIIISLELILLALNMEWIGLGVSFDDRIGQLVALIVLTVAAAESAIGLGILVIYYRIRGTISLDWGCILRG